MADDQDNSLDLRLGLEHGHRAAWVGLPASLVGLPLARRFRLSQMVIRARELSPGPFDMIHLFTMSHHVLEGELPLALERLAPGGMIWVSWPNPSANLPTDMTEGAVRTIAQGHGLAEAKACAIDAIWTGLKLVADETA